MIELLLFTLAGCAIGIFTGLTPGIHVNTASLFLLGAASAVNPYFIAVMIISMAITSTFFDFYPSILLGAPESETALGVLPGHQMLLERRGVEAIYLTLSGGLGSVFLTFLLFPLFLAGIPLLYHVVQGYIHWVLIAITAVMVAREGSWRGRALAMVVFVLSSFLGMLVLDSCLLPSGFLLFPAFTGLFGMSTLLISLGRGASIPKQDMAPPGIPGRLALSGIVKGLFSGALVGTLPGVGAAQATVLTQEMTRRGDNREFLVSIGAINTITALFSLISLYTISKARSGAALAVEAVIGEFGLNELLLLVAVAMIAAGVSALLMLRVTKVVVRLMQSINYKMLTVGVLAFLVALTIIFTGPFGLLILFTSTSIGLMAPLFGVKRSNLMGFLIGPLIIYYMFVVG